MPTVVSRPMIFSSTRTSESNFSAPASASGQSSTRSTNCSPTLEPCRDGLTTSGSEKFFGKCAAGEFTVTNPAVGTPSAMQLLLRQHLVKSNAARIRVAASVRHAEEIQLPLHRAVLAVGAVQRQKNHVRLRRQNPVRRPRVEFGNFVAERTQCPPPPRRSATTLRARRWVRPA